MAAKQRTIDDLIADKATAARDIPSGARVIDGAIVTEPSALGVCLAHKGYCWIEVRTEGRAAHGSRFAEGVDAFVAKRPARFSGR